MALTRPRFRRDLIAVPTEVDGIAYVDVSDPKGGEPFRFYDFEYKVALAFDGLSFDRVVPWVRFSAGLELSEDQLREFAEELGRRGFLEEREGLTPQVEIPAPPPTQTLAFAPPPAPKEGTSSLASPPLTEADAGPPTPEDVEENVNEFAFEPTVASERVRSEAKPDPPVDPPPEAAPEAPEEAVVPPEAALPEAAPEAPEEAVVPPEATLQETAPEAPEEAVVPPEAALSEAAPEAPQAEPAPPEVAPAESPAGMSLAEEMLVVASPVPPTMDEKAIEEAKRAAEMAKLWDPEPEEDGTEEGGLPPIEDSPPAPTQSEGEVALPAWMSAVPSPPAIMTPAPVTFGPALSAEAPSVMTIRRRRRSFLFFATMGGVAGTLVFVLAWQLLSPEKTIPLPRVKTLKVEPATVRRFYPIPAEVTRAEGKVFTMPAAGKLYRIPTVGAHIVPGDVIGQTDKAKAKIAQLARLRERLAYNTQLRDTMQAEGNTAEVAVQEGKIAERTAQIDKLLQSLSNLVPVADAGGEVAAVLATEGASLAAGAPVVRLRSAGFHARFPLTRPEVNRTKRERLCSLWIGERLIDCTLLPGSETDAFVVAEVAAAKAGKEILGKPARLIRALYRNAVEVPAATVVHGESSDRVWLLSPRGRVEPRPVTVAESDDESAILVQGLDSGDVLVAEPQPSLSAGSLVRASEPETYVPKVP